MPPPKMHTKRESSKSELWAYASSIACFTSGTLVHAGTVKHNTHKHFSAHCHLSWHSTIAYFSLTVRHSNTSCVYGVVDTWEKVHVSPREPRIAAG